MTAALLTLLDDITPGYEFDEWIPPLIRHLIGNETADMIGVPESDRVDGLRRLLRDVNWFDRLMSPFPRFGGELLKGWLRLERGGERAPFDIPDHLALSWQIRPGTGPVK